MQKNIITATFGFRFASLVALLGLSLFVVAGAPAALAQASTLRTFSSPTQALSALVQATDNDDESALEAILGIGKDVTSSGDGVQDKLEREQFCKKYREMHRLVHEPDGRTVLYIGAENWPFPIPLVSKNGKWFFDSDTGKQEIRFRAIGENEAIAIQVCEEFAIARKHDGVKADSEDPITRFAENLVAAGAANTYDNNSKPFQGYYFRIVRSTSAVGASDNKRARGLTLVAYPADYRASGVMTFVVTHRGIVYQKDLGSNTATAAREINAPSGQSWHPVV
jgi:hypothetical protein